MSKKGKRSISDKQVSLLDDFGHVTENINDNLLKRKLPTIKYLSNMKNECDI